MVESWKAFLRLVRDLWEYSVSPVKRRETAGVPLVVIWLKQFCGDIQGGQSLKRNHIILLLTRSFVEAFSISTRQPHKLSVHLRRRREESLSLIAPNHPIFFLPYFSDASSTLEWAASKTLWERGVGVSSDEWFTEGDTYWMNSARVSLKGAMLVSGGKSGRSSMACSKLSAAPFDSGGQLVS